MTPPVLPSAGAAGPDDRALLARHVSGDPDAFAELVRRHRDRLWAVALRTLGDREEAADALQDALISALRGAARFRGDAAVTTWLHRIVVNACLDRIRRRQVRPTVPLADTDPSAPPVDSDTVLDVRGALARLPDEQRIALILVDIQGYPVSEVATILAVPEGTVKSRCARGRARLATLLGHLRNPPPDQPVGSSTGTGAAPGPSGGTGQPGGGGRSEGVGPRDGVGRQRADAARLVEESGAG